MKKAYELSTLTGTQILVLVTSETGHVYTFATRKFQPFINEKKGKNLIQECLAATDVEGGEVPNFEENEDERENEEKKEVQQVISGEMNIPAHHYSNDYQRYNNIPIMTDMNPRVVVSKFYPSQQQPIPEVNQAHWNARIAPNSH